MLAGTLNVLMEWGLENLHIQHIAQWDSSVGFLKSYFFECKSGRNSIKVAEKWT